MSHQNKSANESRSVWFPAKRYGWGWGLPITWQGWVEFIAWLVIVTAVAPFLASRSLLGFASFMLVMAFVQVAICYAKGEPPRWRWGK